MQEPAGPLQTGTGLKTGAEAAMHSMQLIFEDSSTKAVILVDANNAFNSIDRKVALHNIEATCPRLIRFLKHLSWSFKINHTWRCRNTIDQRHRSRWQLSNVFLYSGDSRNTKSPSNNSK